jgi:type III pantothenate kinase
MLVEPGIKTGVKINVDNPREVGADRIVNTLAAHVRYGGPAIVIDCSTATTFDAVSANGDYLGSVIAPGIEMAMEALARQTAQLHKVELARPARVIGTNTTSAIQSGVVYGFAGLVDGLVGRIAEELGGQARVIATGPFAKLVQASTRSINMVDPLLTLEGLRIIWEMNARERGAVRP